MVWRTVGAVVVGSILACAGGCAQLLGIDAPGASADDVAADAGEADGAPGPEHFVRVLFTVPNDQNTPLYAVDVEHGVAGTPRLVSGEHVVPTARVLSLTATADQQTIVFIDDAEDTTKDVYQFRFDEAGVPGRRVASAPTPPASRPAWSSCRPTGTRWSTHAATPRRASRPWATTSSTCRARRRARPSSWPRIRA
jgi:hypothetical protein